MTERFRPLGDATGFDLIDPVQQHLEERGWRPLLGPGSRWVEHLHENDQGSLRVAYSPGNRDFDLAFQTGALGAEIYLALPDDFLAILEVVIRHQDTLSVETWPTFIEELLATGIILFAVTEDEDEEDVEVDSPEMGTTLLREGEWIIDGDDDMDVSEDGDSVS